jgi:hypothetical protein
MRRASWARVADVVRLHARALAHVARARVALTLEPGALQRLAREPSEVGMRGWGEESAVRAIGRASRLVPGASCLVRAVAARALLADAGIRAQVCIGVQPRDRRVPGSFAHAWLERDGRVLLGGGAGEYQPLGRLGARAT